MFVACLAGNIFNKQKAFTGKTTPLSTDKVLNPQNFEETQVAKKTAGERGLTMRWKRKHGLWA